MNILTFDVEEWYLEKTLRGGNVLKYQQLDKLFGKLLDELDKFGTKATFFCVGQLAVDFPDVVKAIVLHGHEVGCHSNVHTWLDKMDEKMLRHDTTEALKALQDVSGQKVVSYRAPAFSITAKNPWAVYVLADCGIENDASIFPTSRDFGGYKGFPQDTPCLISYEGAALKEYPISLTSVFGKQIAYSGGGYFRLLPYWFVDRTIKHREYNICYFHLADLNPEKKKMMSKVDYEEYFKKTGTFKNRLARYIRGNIGTGDAYGKLAKLLSQHNFVCVKEADALFDWEKVVKVSL